MLHLPLPSQQPIRVPSNQSNYCRPGASQCLSWCRLPAAPAGDNNSLQFILMRGTAQNPTAEEGPATLPGAGVAWAVGSVSVEAIKVTACRGMELVWGSSWIWGLHGFVPTQGHSWLRQVGLRQPPARTNRGLGVTNRDTETVLGRTPHPCNGTTLVFKCRNGDLWSLKAVGVSPPTPFVYSISKDLSHRNGNCYEKNRLCS